MNQHSIKRPIYWQYAHTESLKWSKWGQYWIKSSWNGTTHALNVQSSPNEVSIEWKAHGMELRTPWESEAVEARSALSESSWNGITHRLRDQNGRHEVSIEWHDGMWLRTGYKIKMVKSRSELTGRLVRLHYAQAEGSRSSKEVSIEWNPGGMELRTGWTFDMVKRDQNWISKW